MPLSQDPSKPYHPYIGTANFQNTTVNPDLIECLVGALRWLLDDLEDANEAQSEPGVWYDSVAYAYAALDRATPEPHDPPLVKVSLETHRIVPDTPEYIEGARQELWEEIFDMPEELVKMVGVDPAWGCTAADIETAIVESVDFAHGKELD